MNNRRLLIRKQQRKATYIGNISVGVFTPKKGSWKAYGFLKTQSGITGAISPITFYYKGTSFAIEGFYYRTDMGKLYFYTEPTPPMPYSFTLNINGIDYHLTRKSSTMVPETERIANPLTVGAYIPIKLYFD